MTTLGFIRRGVRVEVSKLGRFVVCLVSTLSWNKPPDHVRVNPLGRLQQSCLASYPFQLVSMHSSSAMVNIRRRGRASICIPRIGGQLSETAC
jgi:hypothetical protein